MIIMLILPLFKVNVKIAISISALFAAIETYFIQNYSITDIIKYAIISFQPEHMQTGDSFKGGGLLSMFNVICILLISGTFSKIFQLNGCLYQIQNGLRSLYHHVDRFLVSLGLSLSLSAIFCSQIIAVMMLDTLIEEPYQENGASQEEIALDISNSVIVVSSLVPWSLSIAVLLNILQISVAAIPYVLFIYAVPLCYLLTKKYIFSQEELIKTLLTSGA